MTQANTFLDAVVAQLLEAGEYNRNDQVAPAAVLWPDEQRQWDPVVSMLRDRLPLLTLGAYDPSQRTGPAYWVRCMASRALPDDKLPGDGVPIVYLPGYGKQDLRAIESCPKPLQPLAELRYRGTLWVHRNGRDWTVAGFLHNLGIPVLADNETKMALPRALLRLVHEPLERLKKRAPLDAAFLNELLHPDPARQMLLWLSNPQGFKQPLTDDEWSAFCALSWQRYAIDPQRDGPLTAAKALSATAGEWAVVWQRYTDAPEAYPGIPDLLERVPQGQLTFGFEPSPASPQYNRAQEDALRQALVALSGGLPDEVRQRIAHLDKAHGERRNWVWAKLGDASLAEALVHLSELARLTATPLAGSDVQVIAEAYTTQGWKVDLAVLDALASVQNQQDVAAVKSAVDPLYRKWVTEAAVRLQQAILPNAATSYGPHPLPPTEAGTCILFSDALRYDVGQRLAGELECRSRVVRWLGDWRPFHGHADGETGYLTCRGQARGRPWPGFTPMVASTGTALTADSLRKLVHDAGWQVLGADELGDPAGRAWTEAGAIDSYGHQHGWRVAHHARDEVYALADRVDALLDQGWQRVIVVTDHGWLLLPGGLPKVDLPIHLTKTRKGRCAAMKTGAVTDQQTVPWHWNNDVRIAIAPGISCYEAGKEYEHGGISPQECIVPVITVRSRSGPSTKPTIEDVIWRGLRCYVTVSGDTQEATVDIRLKAADAKSSIAVEAKTPDAAGMTSLIVPDEDYEGEAAFVVVLMDETPVAQQLTIVGE